MKNNWTTLDHAAKLFIAGASRTETQVFRFSCDLRDTVDPELLQAAVDFTLEYFPSYRVVLKKGFFWYYLEESQLQPVVQPETKRLCGDMGCSRSKKLLFEVTYFSSRINLEVYHVLSDGTSATQFFNMLVSKYISLAYNVAPPTLEVDASHAQSKDDSYSRYYTGEKRKREKTKTACSIQGSRYSENFLRNITGQLPAKKVLALAKEYNTTATVFLCACIISAVGQNTTARERKKPIVLSVPVNLRSYFPSASARNFFGAIYVSYQWQKNENKLEDIIQAVNTQFRQMLTREFLGRQIDEQSAAENNFFAKIAPLFLKTTTLRVIYHKSLKGVTASISNVGRIILEPRFADHIRTFDVCSSTNKFQACVCSFGDVLSIGCTNPHISSDIERTFFRMFSQRDIEVTIMSNVTEEVE